MEGLSYDNILGGSEIDNLFTEANDDIAEEQKKDEGAEENAPEEKDSTAEEVNPDTLFEEDAPEGVGSGKDKDDNQGAEDADTASEQGISPNEHIFSSIASACAEEGIFPDLDEETIKKVETAEDFRDLIEAQINAGLDERQKRVSDALNYGVEPSDIRKYEGTLNYLATITDASLNEESEKGEQLRRQLIYQDFINKGYTPAKAEKFTKRTIDAGTDIEDAKEALQSNKEYFQGEYDRLVSNAKVEVEKEAEERKVLVGKMKDSIMKDKQLFGDIEIDSSTRKKAVDNISKPIYKDPETGEYYTALQKYEMEHRADFIKYVGLVYTMTNGFKDFDSFTKGKVKREVKKGLRELESTLRNTKSNSGGNLQLVTNKSGDDNSFIARGLRLDI